MEIPGTSPVQLRRHSIDHFERRTARSLPNFNPFAASLAFPRLDSTRPRPLGQRHHSAHVPTTASSSGSEVGDSDDSIADEDGYSEVEFWGGESPRLRAAASSTQVEYEVALESETESEEEDDDDDDEDEDFAIDDDEGESRPGLLDQLDIPGHR